MALLNCTNKWYLHGALYKWGQNAVSEELCHAAKALIYTTDPTQLRHILTIYAKTPFPLCSDYLLPLIYHRSRQVVLRAIEALCKLDEPHLRELALALITDPAYPHTAFSLFTRYYREEDEALLTNWLDKADSNETIHNLGYAVVSLEKKAPLNVLLALYERQPCALCRSTVVDLLSKHFTVPSWMREECRYDVLNETRILVA